MMSNRKLEAMYDGINSIDLFCTHKGQLYLKVTEEAFMSRLLGQSIWPGGMIPNILMTKRLLAMVKARAKQLDAPEAPRGE